MINNSRAYLNTKKIFFCENGILNSYKLGAMHTEEIGLYEIDNLTIGGRGNYIEDFKKNKSFFMPRNIVPTFFIKRIENMISEQEVPKYFSFKERYLDEEVVFISLPYGMTIYGHVLVEILPRLFLLKLLYPEILKKYKIVLQYEVIPEWFFNIMYELFDIDKSRIERYSENIEVLTVKKAYIPTLLHTDYALHPIMNQFVSYVKDKLDIQAVKGFEKIYISRSKLKNPVGPPREFINAEEIEDFFSKQNFKIIYPERLSFREQVQIFTSAKIIAGPFGSGLHNTLFSNFNTDIISFNKHTLVQDHIARLRNQNLYHINRDSSKKILNKNVYSISVNDIEKVLEYIKTNKE